MKWKYKFYWNLTDLKHQIGLSVHNLVPAIHEGHLIKHKFKQKVAKVAIIWCSTCTLGFWRIGLTLTALTSDLWPLNLTNDFSPVTFDLSDLIDLWPFILLTQLAWLTWPLASDLTVLTSDLWTWLLTCDHGDFWLHLKVKFRSGWLHTGPKLKLKGERFVFSSVTFPYEQTAKSGRTLMWVFRIKFNFKTMVRLG
jgi:hypothetical protein